MASKKIVFVIVEGPSDDSALSLLLDQLYDDSKVFVYIAHCDITTLKGSNGNNILRRVGSIVNQYKASNHLKKSDFKEIVHIIDMDGAFVPDNAIVEDLSAKKTIYSETEIRTNNIEKIRNRNSVKRECINILSSNPKLCGIPYQAYYMSCNLDHALYGVLNTTDEEKELNAEEFANKYMNDLDGFVEFITKSDFAVGNEYIESWKYIKIDRHSLERHTNFGICVQRALEIK